MRTSVLLWLQFAYSVWQFVRVAKFFRIPSAIVYHTWMWFRNRFFGNNSNPAAGLPFSKKIFTVVVQGTKWTSPQLPQGELGNSRHYLLKRNGCKYIVTYQGAQDMYILERHKTEVLCSSVDLIWPDFFIADAYHWAEGIDKFMQSGAKPTTHEARALFMSSREHFLNQNFLRLLSIIPLMLQAKGFDDVSVYFSLFIIVLDQLSYPANSVWRAFQDTLVSMGRYMISKISRLETRKFVSIFLSTISPRLLYSDQVFRNFYYIRKNKSILVFGESNADHFGEDIRELEEPTELNPYMQLSNDDYNTLEKNMKDIKSIIQVGSLYVEHHVNGACIKTFMLPENHAYYNFIDNEHLHFGSFQRGQELRVRKALKWIEINGRMPVTCNYRGELRAVDFNSYVDSIAQGYGVLQAKLLKGSWV